MTVTERTEYEVRKQTRLGWLPTLAEPLTDLTQATREATFWEQRGYDTRIFHRQVSTTDWRQV